MTPDHVIAVVYSYLAVACIAWSYGYVCRVWIERRNNEADELFESAGDGGDFADLAEPAPAYDWAIRLDSGVGDPPGSWPAIITFADPNLGRP